MRYLRLIHIYAGLILSLLLFILAVTGAALIYKHEYWRVTYPELRAEEGTHVSAEQQAAAIDAAYRKFGSQIQSIKMPEPGIPAFHIYLQKGEAFLSLDAQRWIDEWQAGERVMSFLFDLHAHLLAGETGEFIGGLAGLAGALMAVTGCVLWWPTRRSFRFAALWPNSLSRRSMLIWHRDIGMLLSPLLLLLLLTGSGMVYYTSIQKLFNAAFGDAVPQSAQPAGDPNAPFILPDAATLARVSRHFPEGELLYYYVDGSGQGINRFRLRQTCELHPNGRSFVYTDVSSGQVLAADDACASPPGERLLHTVYPLHAARIASGLYRLLAFITAVVLAGLAVTGVMTYMQQLTRRPRANNHTRLT